jgi:integrase
MTTMKPGDRGWTVYPRDGQFVAKVRIAPGEWRETRVPRVEAQTRTQAERWTSNNIDRLRSGEPLVKKVTVGPTVDALRDDWIKLLESRVKTGHRKPSYSRGHRSNLDGHIKATLGSVPVTTLTPAIARKWVRDLRLRTCSYAGKPKKRASAAVEAPPRVLASLTVRNMVATITCLFDDIVGEEWAPITTNPFREKCVRDELPTGESRAGDGVVIHITIDQAERVIACTAVDEMWRVLYLLAVTSGAREDELSALTWTDVDLEAEIPVLRISKSVDRVDGKLVITKPKTRHGTRVIPLHSRAVPALKAFKAGGWVRFVGRHARPTDPVFPGAEGCMRMLSGAAAQLRKDLLRAGCPDKFGGGFNITFHALRASFATWLFEGGVDEGIRKRLMGHAPAGVTMKSYTSQALGILRKAIETIKLDLVTGDVLQLPFRVAVGANAANDGSSLARAKSEPAASQTEIEGDSRSRFRDLNSRPTVYETVALPLS